jgi:hypothetical protein
LAVKETPPNRRIMREGVAKSLVRNAARQEKGAKPAGPIFVVADPVALKSVVNRRHKLALRCKGPYEVVRSKVAWEVPFEPDLTLVEVYLSRDGAP